MRGLNIGKRMSRLPYIQSPEPLPEIAKNGFQFSRNVTTVRDGAERRCPGVLKPHRKIRKLHFRTVTNADCDRSAPSTKMATKKWRRLKENLGMECPYFEV
ncbi:unnamed protein product [Ixodes pacificus]